MSVISYILIGLIPFGILNFVLKWKSVKEVAAKSFHWLTRKSVDITNVSSLSSRQKSVSGVVNIQAIFPFKIQMRVNFKN